MRFELNIRETPMQREQGGGQQRHSKEKLSYVKEHS